MKTSLEAWTQEDEHDLDLWERAQTPSPYKAGYSSTAAEKNFREQLRNLNGEHEAETERMRVLIK
jgi:hypothetical protein